VPIEVEFLDAKVVQEQIDLRALSSSFFYITIQLVLKRPLFEEFCSFRSDEDSVEEIYGRVGGICRVRWVLATTARRVLRLQMGERPPVMERSCEYIE
jgi:hypothetical protein